MSLVPLAAAHDLSVREEQADGNGAMSDTSIAPPVRVDGPVSIARLHGRACWDCGAVAKDLKPAGTVTLAGSTREWPIVTCGCGVGAVAS